MPMPVDRDIGLSRKRDLPGKSVVERWLGFTERSTYLHHAIHTDDRSMFPEVEPVRWDEDKEQSIDLLVLFARLWLESIHPSLTNSLDSRTYSMRSCDVPRRSSFNIFVKNNLRLDLPTCADWQIASFSSNALFLSSNRSVQVFTAGFSSFWWLVSSMPMPIRGPTFSEGYCLRNWRLRS